ncbi:LysR family transcriptional regulator [Sporosarcina sp. 6E9]|uniref:LysR family transcriptional regulator n=1 Tax=Sporosarcina sp. 6E9 TaxID=2819235 RepID=UPI001AC2BF66|nr:LysR family transcriptional regulator [Sporosarcina sp. 6E9]MBO1909968.1 LysR family transcriptional regulator [Microvirga sp. 3-52]
MDEKDLEILIKLNEERNITKVAESMYITQPALSYRIQQIEKNVNATLFVRGRMGMRPTPQGEVFIDYAKNILSMMEEARETILQMNTEITGTIKLGVASTFGQYIMPNLLQDFLIEHPKVNANIITGLSTELAKHLESEDVHIAIIRGYDQWAEQKMLICEESIYVVSKDPIELKGLPDESMIYYKMDTYLKSLVDEWWKERFSEQRTSSMTVDSLETSKEMVRIGLGYTILPGICLSGERDLHFQQLINIAGEPVKRKTWALYKEESLNFKAVKSFIEFLDKYKEKIRDY